MKFSSNCAVSVITLIFLASCATLKVSTNVQSGRLALKENDPKEALAHFETAAKLDPSYTTRFTLLHTGIWTYVGRAYLDLGQTDEALANLRKAKQAHDRDYFASIYLGLAMAKSGQRDAGFRELKTGLNGLQNWLDNITWQGSDGQYWDPDGHLKNGIARTQDLLKGERINLAQVDESVQSLGRKFEEEIEEVKDDKQQELREDDNDSGRP